MNAETNLVDFELLQVARAAESASHLPIFNAFDLGNTEFPSIRFIVPGILPEGATLLAGRPKLGKSWLALDIALAVAKGEDCLGVTCTQGDALYLGLEDNKRRIQSRLQKLSPARALEPWPARLEFATSWNRHDEGGLEDIRNWAKSKLHPRLVVVDVLAQFRGARSNNDYDSDYHAIKELQELAGELQMAILIVHHVRKSAGEFDPFEKISGTLGLSGAADTAIVLDRDSNGCTLFARGRDLEEFEKAVTFDKFECRWVMMREAASVRRTDERQRILDVLLEVRDAMSPTDIADASAMQRNNVKQLLFKMVKSGEVNKAGRGQYIHPDFDTPKSPDNLDNQVTNDAGNQ